MHLNDNRVAFAGARDLLLEGQSVRISVRGQSMLPFFRSGGCITLRPIREEDFRVGRVVLAETPQGNFVVHRIYRLEGDRVTLLGDGNLAGTETMPRKKVYGTVDCSRLICGWPAAGSSSVRCGAGRWPFCGESAPNNLFRGEKEEK